MIEIKKGLDLPISGQPLMQVENSNRVRHTALLGCDYPEVKPAFLVSEGDRVVLGQPLFSDKKNPRILFTAPASGKITAINRGERRVFLSIVIAIEGEEKKTFPVMPAEGLTKLTAGEVEQRLLDSGLWPAFRTRPFSHIPQPESRPAAIFVTLMDTNPLAPAPRVALQKRTEEFIAGLQIIRHMTEGTVHLCKKPETEIRVPEGIKVSEFSGCHPAGLVGTHIHFLEHIDPQRTVWHIGYQDVIAIGHLFLTGTILTERIISLAGPAVKTPRLIQTSMGACLSELTDGELKPGENRVISGSVFSGHTAAQADDFLGRYHQQVSVLAEGRMREFMGWNMPGLKKFSVKNVFASAFFPRRRFDMTTSTHGSPRAMVPVGAYEKVMPLHIKATWLLRALLTQDTDLARNLGCLELDEEDLALCSFVCPGKIDFGSHLRQTLKRIEIEG